MSERRMDEGDFTPERGWVVVTGRNKRSGKRYVHPSTMRYLRRDAIAAYLDGTPWTWDQAKRRRGCAVVRCTLTPARRAGAATRGENMSTVARMSAAAELAVELADRIGIDIDELPHDAGMLWLHNEVLKGRGAVTFCQTEDGDIGVFVGDDESARGVGDSPREAIDHAFDRWMDERQEAAHAD